MKSFCPSKKKCNLGGQLGDKFGEKRQIWTLKNKNLQIWALFIVLEIKQIMSNICRWYVFLCKNHFPTQNLLPDAKVLENVLKRLFAGYFTASYFGKMMQAFTEVLRYKVGGEAVCHALTHTTDGGKGIGKGFIVADVGNDDFVLRYFRYMCSFY